MERSWFRVGSSELGAARFFDWGEFHKFDAGIVGIVQVELPFAIATDFWGGIGAHIGARLFQRGCGHFNVFHADRNVIHDAERLLVRGGTDVQHVLDPIGAIGNLHGDPVGVGILHAAVPIGAKSENVLVEMIHGGAVFDDETGVYYAHVTGTGRPWVVHRKWSRALDEGNRIAFGVSQFKMLHAVSIF